MATDVQFEKKIKPTTTIGLREETSFMVLWILA